MSSNRPEITREREQDLLKIHDSIKLIRDREGNK